MPGLDLNLVPCDLQSPVTYPPRLLYEVSHNLSSRLPNIFFHRERVRVVNCASILILFYLFHIFNFFGSWEDFLKELVS